MLIKDALDKFKTYVDFYNDADDIEAYATLMHIFEQPEKDKMRFTDAIYLAMNGVKVKRYSYYHNKRIYMNGQLIRDENILSVKGSDDLEVRLTEEDIFAVDWERA